MDTVEVESCTSANNIVTVESVVFIPQAVSATVLRNVTSWPAAPVTLKTSDTVYVVPAVQLNCFPGALKISLLYAQSLTVTALESPIY